MKRIVLALCLFSLNAAPQDGTFYALDVYIDTGGTPLAAFQFEVISTGKIVGVENADFSDKAPYHDPDALKGGRIIVAAFTTEEDPPAGRVRVARLHMYFSGVGKPDDKAEIIVTATPGGERMDASIELVREGGD